MLLLVPLLRPLFEGLRAAARAVAPAALAAPSATAHPSAHSKAEEGDAEQPEQAEQDQQEPEDSEQAEAESAAPVVGAVVIRRAVACDGVGRQVGGYPVRPSDVVCDRADDDQHDCRHQQPDQTESASHVESLLCVERGLLAAPLILPWSCEGVVNGLSGGDGEMGGPHPAAPPPTSPASGEVKLQIRRAPPALRATSP